MKYNRVLNRRTLLRGAGTVAIGLPFLDEMFTRSVWAAPADPPARAIDIFFGEGMPTHVQEDFLATLTGPLEPLKKHQAKLGFVRGCAYPQTGGAHESGAMSAFVGASRWRSKNQAGGPSLDQVLLQELYPQGMPAGIIPTLAMGFYGSYRINEEHWRRVKSWKSDGSPSELPKAYPSDLFKRIFGTTPDLAVGENMDAAKIEQAARLFRRRKSVLDSVTSQYKHITSDAGNLSLASRTRVSDHLQRLREYEQRAFSMPDPTKPADKPSTACRKPASMADPPLFNGQTPFNGVDLNVNDISKHWRLLTDLFVMAYRCDMARVGSANFLNVGDRIDVRGRYEYEGRMIYEFNDSRDRGGAGEGERVNHESFHSWDTRGNKVAPHHLHFHMGEIAYMLSQLDDPQFKDANGGTLLDNAMVMITTELSEPGSHSVTNMFHAMGPAGGRLKTAGTVTNAGDGKRPAVDIYNTVLRAYGITKRTMGADIATGEIAAMRV